MKRTEPVRVAVNIRPLTASEGCTDCITVTPDEPQVHIGSHTFMYDFVFGNDGLPFSQIYHQCVAPLVEDLFNGYNATVLAYGQTASGKTYTMGTNCGTNGAIIPKVMEHLFTRVESVKSHIRVSFLEIYNEEIYDLLATKRAPIIIREADGGKITLQGVTEVQVKSKEEMSSYLARGSLTRATATTNMNIQSSRSHAIFSISLQITTAAEETLCGKISLVDLAGSERANRTGADGLRLKEGRHINNSLLALSNVIKKLGDERNRKKGVHIPYRVSKLTRLLQDSLGGNSKTVMIACVSPASTDVEETLNTLRYANCARKIKNKAVVQKHKPPSAPSSVDYDAMFEEELTPSKSDDKTVYDKEEEEDVFQAFSELKIPLTSQAATRFDDLFASTSSPSVLKKHVYDKPVYDEDVFDEAITELRYNEDVFEAIHELQYNEDVVEAISELQNNNDAVESMPELQNPSTSQPDDGSSEDVFEAISELQNNNDAVESMPELQIPSTSQPDDGSSEDVVEAISELQKNNDAVESMPELQIPSTSQPDDGSSEDVFEAISELQNNNDVIEAISELQYDEDVIEDIPELQIPSTSQADDVSSSSLSELRKHNISSLDVSPKKTQSDQQEDKCQNKPVETIDLTDDEAEVQEKCFIDLTAVEEAEVEEKPFIDLTTAPESQEKLDLELKELNKRLKEKEREIEGLRQKLASKSSSATPYCTCSKRSSCKTVRCQCAVANRFCVSSCGCSSVKCSNRSREERL